MRNEKEMFDLILTVANDDERIRAVYMNGSRANPNAPKDQYQDYDIVYVVTETESFIKNKSWIAVFGEIAMVQEPDINTINSDIGDPEDVDFSRSFAWLMLFKDGTRIDLTIKIMEKALHDYTEDTLTVPLLDKDGILPPIPESNDKGYWIQKPTIGYYNACCNEFWWCLNNVAKGIARDELPYAMEMYHHYVRDMLNKMLEWYIGIQNDFSISAGKMGKSFNKYLPHELYDRYVKTYSNGDYDNLWASIFIGCGLFRVAANMVAEHFSYTYNKSDDMNMTEYLNHVKDNGIL